MNSKFPENLALLPRTWINPMHTRYITPHFCQPDDFILQLQKFRVTNLVLLRSLGVPIRKALHINTCMYLNSKVTKVHRGTEQPSSSQNNRFEWNAIKQKHMMGYPISVAGVCLQSFTYHICICIWIRTGMFKYDVYMAFSTWNVRKSTKMSSTWQATASVIAKFADCGW